MQLFRPHLGLLLSQAPALHQHLVQSLGQALALRPEHHIPLLTPQRTMTPYALARKRQHSGKDDI